MVTLLLAVVLLVIGWFWWRSDAVNGAPDVRAAAEMPLPVVTGDFERASGECGEPMGWESVHARPWQALSQTYAGTLDTCVEVYRALEEDDGSGDYYVALVTSVWSTDEREDSWWPWEGRDDLPDPIRISLALDPSAAGDVYAASNPEGASCAAAVPFAPVALEGSDDVMDPPTFLAGTCEGEALRTAYAADGVAWTLTRPEEWDVTVLSYGFKVAEGATPRVTLAVDRVGVEG